MFKELRDILHDRGIPLQVPIVSASDHVRWGVPLAFRAATLAERGAGHRNLGRGSRIRTCGPLLPKQVLYQAELCPDTLFSSAILADARSF